jgi:hypothetical protein
VELRVIGGRGLHLEIHTEARERRIPLPWPRPILLPPGELRIRILRNGSGEHYRTITRVARPGARASIRLFDLPEAPRDVRTERVRSLDAEILALERTRPDTGGPLLLTLLSGAALLGGLGMAAAGGESFFCLSSFGGSCEGSGLIGGGIVLGAIGLVGLIGSLVWYSDVRRENERINGQLERLRGQRDALRRSIAIDE